MEQHRREVILELEEFISSKFSSPIGPKEEVRFSVETDTFDSEYDNQPVALLRITGALEAGTIEKVENQLKKFFDRGLFRILIDFEKITYINSTGMSMFLPYLESIRSKGGRIIFIKTSEKIFKVFEMLGLHTIYIFHSTFNNALREFTKQHVEKREETILVFPFSYQCANCTRMFRIPSSGRYTCPNCTKAFIVDNKGLVRSAASFSSKPIQIRLPTVVSSLSALRGAVRGILASLSFTDEEEYQIIQAVDEACGNVIAYAGKGNADFFFDLKIFFSKTRMEIQILDRGQAFNPLAVKSIDLEKRFQLNKVGGIGLELIKKCMTHVSYAPLKNGGNKLILIKEHIIDKNGENDG